jgi:hypothetical protein
MIESAPWIEEFGANTGRSWGNHSLRRRPSGRFLYGTITHVWMLIYSEANKSSPLRIGVQLVSTFGRYRTVRFCAKDLSPSEETAYEGLALIFESSALNHSATCPLSNADRPQMRQESAELIILREDFSRRQENAEEALLEVLESCEPQSNLKGNAGAE